MSNEGRKTVTAFFRIDKDLYNEVEEVRLKLGQTRSKFMSDAVKKHLADLKKEGVIEKIYEVRRAK